MGWKSHPHNKRKEITMWTYNPETNDKDLWVDLVDENGEPLVDEDGDIIDDPDGYFSNY